MPHYSVPAGQVLVLGWCLTLLIGWLVLRWLATERGVASRALLVVGARLGRGARLVIVGCGAVCLWAGLYFALTPISSAATTRTGRRSRSPGRLAMRSSRWCRAGLR